ncbi:3'-5' exoribonuclease YhaM family protein [Tuwongella immobilis]|uniref:HD/PDEase domain-containing protein n=1 Tax=Tuwongella immobilis TaxID=692036 RepID=A0A6C2YRC3_9BACT|nr:OB-fold nucleic acid binding domain-containing protein [Tuwongella immobilis]VIP03901.1 cmp-binding protein : Putative domain HDIG-containing protein OS=Singulisphaera acidiphila (strain ATCC BAA-1392 / DSM 18658 / VKM B-2454 / MOB10) GN=Sinac_1131 PE=4 SV=1: tRNA_anti-codon: HD [Tuwongella immobilis]VTS05169.1 cmp-binding protein : Putative domain HDIG-containing protein OS=Singulisphaera acidiphila (strain ATCC BAA-1392 / DSM 18658 / VKM B-2454 / MOB10) GN=Sinac_1131 PE=4 SV=1: tRNA_anti-cod
MGRRFIEQLSDGDTVEDIYLVTDRQYRANRNGVFYIQLDLRDKSGQMNARFWNASEALFKSFGHGDFLLVKGKVQSFQGGLQLILTSLERVEESQIELGDFLPRTPCDARKLEERLRSTLLKLTNPHLRALAECYFMDSAFMLGFTQAPAGVRVHHAYIGGLLEHVVAMIDAAERLLPLYPEIDREVLLFGIFLHDSGKVRELVYSRAFGYSDEGQLLGHLAIGCQILEDKIRQVPELTEEPFPAELRLRLQHMILAHHGELQYGSPKVPMTPEAVMLHAIDNLDSRLHIYKREIKEDRGPSAWTPFNSALQRRIYKGGTDGAGADYAAPMESHD